MWSQWGEINADSEPSNAEIRGKAAPTRKVRGKFRNLQVKNALIWGWFSPDLALAQDPGGQQPVGFIDAPSAKTARTGEVEVGRQLAVWQARAGRVAQALRME